MQNSYRSTRLVLAVAAVLLCLVFISPLTTHAQAATSTADLSATIRSAILKDPRAQGLTPTQLEAMVEILTSQAQSQGMTAQDIAYRPGHPDTLGPTPSSSLPSGSCIDISSPLCPLGQALGFDTPDKRVPIGLWITSALLVAVIWHMRKNPHLNGARKPLPPPMI